MTNGVTPDFNPETDYQFMIRHYDQTKEARAFKIVVVDEIFDKVGIEVLNLRIEDDTIKYDAEIIYVDPVLKERLPERFSELTTEKFAVNIKNAVIDHIKKTTEELESGDGNH